MNRFAITIGRELGSGGKIIGDSLAQRFGIACYDKQLINLASQESGLGKEFFERADEKSSFSIPGNIFGFRGFLANGGANYLCNETLFKIQSDVIRNVAERESCIFVGRCADYILREHPCLVRIFITASLKDRIERLCKAHNISEKNARTQIEQTDKKRASYYNYYSNKTWGAANSYDLCINSSLLGIDETVNSVEAFIRETIKNKHNDIKMEFSATNKRTDT